MNKYTIGFKNKHEANTIINLFIALGYKIWDDSDHTKYVDRFLGDGFKNIVITPSTLTISSTVAHATHYWVTYSNQILSELFGPKTIIEGVGDYSATVTPNDIQVAGKIISFEKFQEIADAVAKVKA